MEITFIKQPKALISGKKCITFEELLKLENINEAKQRMIEKEISEILSQDIEVIKRELAQRFKAHMEKFVNWGAFKERFYRRNVLIHNSGLVSRIYIKKTGYSEEEKRLCVTQVYLKESLELFDKAALGISEYFYNKFERNLSN